jgi:hypothetical protein
MPVSVRPNRAAISEADFDGVESALRDFARHGIIGRDIARLGEVVQGLEALPARDNGEFLSLLLYDEVLLQAMRLDAGCEFVNETLVLGFPDVAREGHKLAEGDGLDGGVSHGVVLLFGFEKKREAAGLRLRAGA